MQGLEAHDVDSHGGSCECGRNVCSPLQVNNIALYCISAPPFLGSTEWRGILLMKKRLLLGPFDKPVPQALWGSSGGEGGLMREVPL